MLLLFSSKTTSTVETIRTTEAIKAAETVKAIKAVKTVKTTTRAHTNPYTELPSILVLGADRNHRARLEITNIQSLEILLKIVHFYNLRLVN
jgi:hypothetical protein